MTTKVETPLEYLQRTMDDFHWRLLLRQKPTVQQSYAHYWATRADPHGAHRDILPAWLSGYKAAMDNAIGLLAREG